MKDQPQILPERVATSRPVRIVCVLALTAVLAPLAAGCKQSNFARVNGQTITEEEYIHALESKVVVGPNGQANGNAERAVLDDLITNKIVMADAAQANVLPTEEAVDHYFDLQKKLIEQQLPKGKDYETSLRENGESPDEAKEQMKFQMAEASLYAKKLNISEDDIHKAYDKTNGQFGLPARVLLRLVLVGPNTPAFARAKQEMAEKVDFEQIAKELDPPQLRPTAGLLPQFTPINQITPKYQGAITKANPGDVIGPVDFQVSRNGPQAKAWIRVEEKRPAYVIPFEEAEPLIRNQLVGAQLALPQNAEIRNQIIGQKLSASFEPSEARYSTVWDAIKKQAQDQGIGQPAPTAPIGGATNSLSSSGATGGAPVPAAVPSTK